MEDQPIDDGSLMNIEQDYYERLFNNRLSPSRDGEKREKKSFPFEHMWELFVYAAVLGFRRGNPKPLAKLNKSFRWGNIGGQHRKNLLTLAVAKAGAFEILLEKERIKQFIEEYANAGLAIIDQELKNNPAAYSDLETFTLKILHTLPKS
jgi:dnd system-associated protein 4